MSNFLLSLYPVSINCCQIFTLQQDLASNEFVNTCKEKTFSHQYFHRIMFYCLCITIRQRVCLSCYLLKWISMVGVMLLDVISKSILSTKSFTMKKLKCRGLIRLLVNSIHYLHAHFLYNEPNMPYKSIASCFSDFSIYHAFAVFSKQSNTAILHCQFVIALILSPE